jgi:hypothetical protein
MKKIYGFRKLIYIGISLAFIITTAIITRGWNTHFTSCHKALLDDCDERDEDRWLIVLRSSSLEEPSQVLTLVSAALALLLLFVGSAIVGQLSLKWPFSLHAKHPLFLCFFCQC